MTNQSRPWLSLAALMALAGCCMSPPSPVDGVPYGGWIGGSPSPDRGAAPEPVSVPPDSPPDLPVSRVDTEVPPPTVTPAAALPVKEPPTKPSAKVDPLRQPLRLPTAVLDRSPSLALDRSVPQGGPAAAIPRITLGDTPSLPTGTASSPTVKTPSAKTLTPASSSVGLSTTLGSRSESEKNPTLHLGSLPATGPASLSESKLKTDEVRLRGSLESGTGNPPSLSLPTVPSLAVNSANPATLVVNSANAESSSTTTKGFSLGVDGGGQNRGADFVHPLTLDVAQGDSRPLGATESTTSRAGANLGGAADLKTGTSTLSLGSELGTGRVAVSPSHEPSTSLSVGSAQALPAPVTASSTALSVVSAPKRPKASVSTPVEISTPHSPSVRLNESQNTPTLKSVSSPRTAEIKVEESVSVKTGTAVTRTTQGVPSPVTLSQPVHSPLVSDRSKPISAATVLQASAPTELEVTQREEEKRLRDEELRSQESSLRKWLHDHLPLFF